MVALGMLVVALPACSGKKPTAPAPIGNDSEIARNFGIGQLKAISLRDGTIDVPNDNKIFDVGGNPQEVAAALMGAGLPTDTIRLSVGTLLVRGGGHVMLFDTGAGINYGDGVGRLQRNMMAVGITPAEITDVFISHAHGDHVGGLVDEKGTAVFAGATIHIAAAEWELLKGLDVQSARALGIIQYDALMAAMKSRTKAFAPGATVLPGLVKAVEFRGHTPGHSGYMVGEGKDSLLYIGDVMHHSVISVQKPEWANGFDTDKEAGVQTRKELLDQATAYDQRIFATHFPFPGIGRISKNGAGYQWVAE
jgi:glyoxylase-like metal-dependent hydrolase (beta-lactamase superfamily II)